MLCLRALPVPGALAGVTLAALQTELLSADNLRPLNDESVRSVPPLARNCALAAVKGPAATDAAFDDTLQAFHELVWGQELLGTRGRALAAQLALPLAHHSARARAGLVHFKDTAGKLHVSLQRKGEETSITAQLLEQGLLRILARPSRNVSDLVAKLQPLERTAQHKHVSHTRPSASLRWRRSSHVWVRACSLASGSTASCPTLRRMMAVTATHRRAGDLPLCREPPGARCGPRRARMRAQPGQPRTIAEY